MRGEAGGRYQCCIVSIPIARFRLKHAVCTEITETELIVAQIKHQNHEKQQPSAAYFAFFLHSISI